MFEFLWEIHQQRKIHEAAESARSAKDSARRGELARERIGDLERRAEKLALISMAQWELQKAGGPFTDEALAEKVKEIDLRDGKLDGRFRPEKTPLQDCNQCGRTISRRHNRCLYCGADGLTVSDPFNRT